MSVTQDYKKFNLSDDVRHTVCICLLHRQQSLLDFIRGGDSYQSWKEELMEVHAALRVFDRELLIKAPK